MALPHDRNRGHPAKRCWCGKPTEEGGVCASHRTPLENFRFRLRAFMVNKTRSSLFQSFIRAFRGASQMWRINPAATLMECNRSVPPILKVHTAAASPAEDPQIEVRRVVEF